jgi:hypothetical protein
MRILLVYSFFSFCLTNFHGGQGLYFLEVGNSLDESLLCVRKLYMQADTWALIQAHLTLPYTLISSQSTQTYLKRRMMRRKTVRVCTNCDTEK